MADIFEDFEPPSKTFLAMPLKLLELLLFLKIVTVLNLAIIDEYHAPNRFQNT